MELDENRDILRGIKRTPEEAERALGVVFSVQIPNSGKRVDTLLIASNSDSKRVILESAMETFGVEVIAPSNDQVIPEADYQEVLRQMETPAIKYSPRLSALKLKEFMDTVKSGIPALAFDTVVVTDQGQVLEKPRSMDEARDVITKLTAGVNNAVSVIDGVTFAYLKGDGKIGIWRSATEIAVALKQAASSDIDEYLDSQGELVLGIAGAIDYASDAGRRLIRTSGGLTYVVGAMKAGEMDSLNGTVTSMEMRDHKGVFLNDSASPILKPYFKGVPIHLVQGIIRNFAK